MLDRPWGCPVLMYSTGEEIRTGDHVRFGDDGGRVELVATPGEPAGQACWQEVGPGVLVSAEAFGRLYVPLPQQLERLHFVSRHES